MGRGLDGYFFLLRYPKWLSVQFSGAARVGGLSRFAVAIARGKHLFPFRTEQLSLSAPMVLGSQGPGRVGRRRFFSTSRLRAARSRLRVFEGGVGSQSIHSGAMSVLGIVLILIGGLLLLAFVG